MKFGWFILGDGPPRKEILTIRASRWILGGLNASATSTHVGTFATSTTAIANIRGTTYGETSTTTGSIIGVLWEQTIFSCSGWSFSIS